MLRESEFFQSRKIRILLCVELFFLLIGVAGLFGVRGMVVGREDTVLLLEEGVSLPAGAYTLRVFYEAENGNGSMGSFGVTVEEGAPYRTLLSNSVPFYAGLSQGECLFYLTGPAEGLKLVLKGAEGVRFLGAELLAGNQGSRIYLFWVILFCFILNLALILAMYHRRHPIPRERQMVFFGIPVLTLIVSLPVLVDYNISGGELTYQLLRIEALAERIAGGELTLRMSSLWLAGHGYGDSLFTSDISLLVPALLRLLGFPVGGAYGIFVVLANLATVWVAYLCFFHCFRNRYVAFFGSALYTLAPYRVYLIYNRAALGEFTAMIFLPLVLWGWYRIYTDQGEKVPLRTGLVLAVGFSGLLLCEVTIGVIAAVAMMILGLVFWRKTFRGCTLWVLLHALGVTLLLNAWLFVPALDLVRADRYYFSGAGDVLIQGRGLLAAQIFYTLQAGGALEDTTRYGMLSTAPIGLGAALLLCLILWLILGNRRERELTEEQKRVRTAGNAGVLFTILVLFMSTRYFPWDRISALGKESALLVGLLETPARLTSLATILGVFVACVLCLWVLGNKKPPWPGKAVLPFLLLGAVVFGNYQVNDILLTRGNILRLYTPQSLNTSAVLRGAYLPEGTVLAHMTYHEPVASEGAVLEAYEKEGLEVSAHLTTMGEAYVDFPMLYYKGYRARVQGTGENLSVEKGENGDVRVWFPKEFQGTVRIWYAGMWYWHAAEVLSLATWTGLLGWWIVRGIRRRSKQVHSRRQ